MLFINHLKPDEWWEWDADKMRAYNYYGGWHDVNENSLGSVEAIQCESWHELYKKTQFCPLERDVESRDVWISTDGKYYDGQAHDVTAEKILEVVFNQEVDFCAGDKLEDKGWIRASTTLMWDIRFDDLSRKTLTKKQYEALWDWCQYHHMKFPEGINTYSF